MAATPVQESPSLIFFERTTRGGRNLIYRLHVLQQPERARACGSGSKSHTDRRPVDPPPVVELRIFEGRANGDPVNSPDVEDITFRYNANLFLFVTLEHARPMAHGRVVNAASQTPPVLTGMPVSGMAYLDRPLEAGYFLFPDLSVRHEGLYRLAFNLYEQTKEERDLDELTPLSASATASSSSSSSSASAASASTSATSPASGSDCPTSPVPGAAPELSFDWRMEIKSLSFRVFSAKKFPGLAESTTLSRTVAEQGCRVRIRRDVRMRRREQKSGDGDGADDFAPSRRTHTPDTLRGRSMSASSDHHPDVQRRPSIHEYPALQPPAFAPSPRPPTPSQHPGSRIHTSHGFATAPPYSPQPYSQHQQQSQPPPISPTTPLCPTLQQPQQHQQHHYLQSSPSPYQTPSQHSQPSHSASTHSASQPYHHHSHQQHHPASSPSPREPSFHRTPSICAVPSPSPTQYSAPNLDRQRSEAAPQQLRADSPAPPQSHPPKPATSRPVLPPLSTITNISAYHISFNANGRSDRIDPRDPESPREQLYRIGAKRGYASTFDACDQPLYNGLRPDSIPSQPRRYPDLLSHAPSGLDNSMVSYTRADGKTKIKEVRY